jgi:hypothetical protein
VVVVSVPEDGPYQDVLARAVLYLWQSRVIIAAVIEQDVGSVTTRCTPPPFSLTVAQEAAVSSVQDFASHFTTSRIYHTAMASAAARRRAPLLQRIEKQW